MPNLFLSHTSIDKPFVEKLAKDLKRIGVNVWFDKWEIRVGDSITWKIEEGIRENDFLCIVLSPESLNSEWVKSELGSAWSKQMKTKRIIVLPILYRDCNIPSFLVDRKYADFREDYNRGLEELAYVLGIKETDTISENNWRKFYRKRNVDWKSYRRIEFENLVTVLVDRAYEYNWSSWVGGTKTLFSITLSAFHDRNRKKHVTIKLIGTAYMASFREEINPNNFKASDFIIYVGNSINECEEFVWRYMEDFKKMYGNPIDKPFHHTERFSQSGEVAQIAKEIVNRFDWYKGNKLKK